MAVPGHEHEHEHGASQGGPPVSDRVRSLVPLILGVGGLGLAVALLVDGVQRHTAAGAAKAVAGEAKDAIVSAPNKEGDKKEDNEKKEGAETGAGVTVTPADTHQNDAGDEDTAEETQEKENDTASDTGGHGVEPVSDDASRDVTRVHSRHRRGHRGHHREDREEGQHREDRREIYERAYMRARSRAPVDPRALAAVRG